MFTHTVAALLLFLGASCALGNLLCTTNDTRTVPVLPEISFAAYVKGNDSVKPVDVHFHLISTDMEWNKDMMTDAIIDAQFDVLHSTFLRHGFEFNLVNVSRIVDNVLGRKSWYSVDAILPWYRATRRGGYDALNVYFFTDMNDDYGGECELPMNVRDGSDDFYRDRCIVNGATLPGMMPRIWNDTVPHKGHVLTHEVGHWLGLYHTWNNRCDEVEGRIADLPAMSDYDDDWGCPEGQDTCPDMPGLDPIHNFMSYVKDSCMWEFTPGQEERMHQLFDTYRRPLSTS